MKELWQKFVFYIVCCGIYLLGLFLLSSSVKFFGSVSDTSDTVRFVLGFVFLLLPCILLVWINFKNILYSVLIGLGIFFVGLIISLFLFIPLYIHLFPDNEIHLSSSIPFMFFWISLTHITLVEIISNLQYRRKIWVVSLVGVLVSVVLMTLIEIGVSGFDNDINLAYGLVFLYTISGWAIVFFLTNIYKNKRISSNLK